MPTYRLLILAVFIAIPLAEIALLIKVGGAIGVLATVGIVIATAVIGTSLLHRQGFGVLARAGESMNSGRLPVEPVIEGILLLIAGAFLLTPGLITDAIGFSLLVPFLRRTLAAWMLKRALRSGMVRTATFTTGRSDGGGEWPDDGGAGSHKGGPSDVIDGEYERVDERTIRPGRDTGPDRGQQR